MFIKISPGSDSLPAERLEDRFKFVPSLDLKSRFQVPEGTAAELHAFDFPHDQQADGHALNSPGRKTSRDLFPQQRAERVAVKSIHDSPSFLSLNEVFIQLPSILNGFKDRRLCDF